MCDCYHEAVADLTWVVNNSNKAWYVPIFCRRLHGIHGYTLATKPDMCSILQQQIC